MWGLLAEPAKRGQVTLEPERRSRQHFSDRYRALCTVLPVYVPNSRNGLNGQAECRLGFCPVSAVEVFGNLLHERERTDSQGVPGAGVRPRERQQESVQVIQGRIWFCYGIEVQAHCRKDQSGRAEPARRLWEISQQGVGT